MAVFSNFPVTLPVMFSPTDTEYHPLHPLLCCAGKERGRGGVTGTVYIFNGVGEMESEDLTLQRMALPSTIAWHPTEKVVVVGWLNGEVIIWDTANNSMQELSGVHSMAICTLTWSPQGTLLVSTDRGGKAALWSYASESKTTKVQEFTIKGAASHCVFRSTEADEASNLVSGSRQGAIASATMFFIATNENRVVQYADGKCSACLTTHPKRISALLFDQTRDTLVTLTEDLMLIQSAVGQFGKLDPPAEAKLSGRRLLEACWVGDGVLATATDDSRLSIWTLAMMDNYVLEPPDKQSITNVAYAEAGKLLTVVTAMGSVWLWRHNGGPASDGEAQWIQQLPVNVDASVDRVVTGGANQGLVAVQTSDGVEILREYVMKCAYGGRTSVLQTASNRAIVEHGMSSSQDLEVPFTIKSICATSKAVLFWSGKQAAVYRLIRDGAGPLQLAGDFKCESVAVALLGDETVFTAHDDSIVGYSIQGVEKQTLKVMDGKVTSLSVTKTLLVASSSGGSIYIWDMGKSEPRTVAPPRSVVDSVDTIVDARVNCDGTRVSFFGIVGHTVEPSVWVWNVENNTLSSHSFDLAGMIPVSHYWDGGEPRLFAVEAMPAGQGPDLKKEVTTFFSTAEEGIVTQHKYRFGRNENSLAGIDVPHLFYGRLDPSVDGYGRGTDARVLSDFRGLEGADAVTKSAMMDFSYYLTLGNMDEAFKSVRAIKSTAVWETMARMCVATRRVDVAAYCLGKMGNAAGARALRAAIDEYPEEEARVATLAVHLGMTDDAETLLAECGRWDLLNKLYQSCGRWDDAIELAKTKDRAHLRNIYHAAGKYQESCGNKEAAIEYFELSQTHLFEVPRLLSDDAEALEAYIRSPGQDPSKRKHVSLLKWWGGMLESLGEEQMDRALEFYNMADDALGQVRVLCFSQQHDKAKELVDASGDRAAAYYLAREFEAMRAENLAHAADRAIEYFSKSGCYNNAIRIAKETGQGKLIYGLAQRSTKKDMLEAAAYYEADNRSIEKAVSLYHKGGRVGKALDLCFRHKMYEPLAEISGDLDSTADPELLRRAATFFTENREYDKAANLLIAARQFDDALTICENERVTITEKMAEDMTLEKTEAGRVELLERIANCCFEQGSYQLATKKYTQAGKKFEAMKSLLKSGDVEKIIFFASRCRQREIYIMAANHLQQLQWQHDQNIISHIIQFYTKAKALDSLSLFYRTCAQVEIDDYQNYDKGVEALTEALKYVSKAKMKDFGEKERRVSELQNQISLVKKFLHVRSLTTGDGNEMLSEARLLLQMPDVESAVRIGDIYGTMIEYLASQSQFQQAYDVMQEMREWNRSVNMVFYVNLATITAIHNALGIPMGSGKGAEGEDGDIEEDLGQ